MLVSLFIFFQSTFCKSQKESQKGDLLCLVIDQDILFSQFLTSPRRTLKTFGAQLSYPAVHIRLHCVASQEGCTKM